MSLFINRRTRVRHVDPHCRAIRASHVACADVDLAERPPARIVEVPDPRGPKEEEAIRNFTSPCTACVPDARESWDLLPLVFELPDEIDPHMDWTDLAIVIRNEPSPRRGGLVRVVGRTRDGEEVTIADADAPVPIGTLIEL